VGGKKLKNLKRFLRIKTNWITIITIVLAAVGLVIGFVFQEFTYQVISGMFLLIVVENFVMQVTYMDEIKSKLDALALQKQNGTIFKAYYECKQPIELMNQVKKELFVNSSNLRFWDGVFDLIASREDLKVRIVVLDFDKPEVRNAYSAFRGHTASTYSSTTNKFLKELIKCPHVEIKKVDFIPMAYFVGIDTNTIDGYIRARFMTNTPTRADNPCIEVTPLDKEWYENLKEQMEVIWNRAKPWKNIENIEGGGVSA